MKKVLLIGGGGYIGSVISDLLIKKNHEITILDNFIYNHKHFIKNTLKNKNCYLVDTDLRNINSYKENLNNVDEIVILAGLVGDPITKEYPNISKKINDDGISNLVDYISDLKNINHTIFISTCSNYGLSTSELPLDENSPLNPISLYAKSKVNIEKKILSLKNKKNFSPTIFRFATAFGLSNRMRFDLTINQFIRELYFGKDLEVYDPETWRPYCHVRDFAEIIYKSLNIENSKIAFEVFNAGSNKNNYSKKKIVDIISNHIPTGNVSYVKGGTDQRNYVVNFDKLTKYFRFEPLISIENSIEEIVNFLKSNSYNNNEVYGNYKINLTNE